MTITDKIDNVTNIPEEYRKAVLPAPHSVKIEISPRCNYRCLFCSLRTREKQPTEDMDFDLFKRITQEMRDASVQECGLFFLGESFMNLPLLVECIKWTKSIGFPYVFLTTNGSLVTKEAAKSVMEAGLDSLKFSMIASDEDQFEYIVGVKKSLYYKALENVKGAWEVREEGHYGCQLYASSIRYDNDQMAKMDAVLDKHIRPYIDQWYDLPLYGMALFAEQRKKELGYEITAGNQGRMGNLREPLPCWTVIREGHVTADGGLSACCFASNSRWQMADLKKVSFMEGWNSPEFVKLREAHLKKDISGTICEGCIAYS